jgi:type IV pilus assembly protein PilA
VEGHPVSARLRYARSTRDDDGFTLIELLVVIIIIGILAAIAIPVFLNQRQKSYDAQAKSDARNAATIEETYLTDYNVYTASAKSTTVPANFAVEGFRMSASTTDITVYTYAPGTTTGGSTTAGQTGSYCIKTTSASSKVFYYASYAGGFTSTPCT